MMPKMDEIARDTFLICNANASLALRVTPMSLTLHQLTDLVVEATAF